MQLVKSARKEPQGNRDVIVPPISPGCLDSVHGMGIVHGIGMVEGCLNSLDWTTIKLDWTDYSWTH